MARAVSSASFFAGLVLVASVAAAQGFANLDGGLVERLDREAAGANAGGLVSASSSEYSDCVPSGPQLTFESGFQVSMCFEHEQAGALLKEDARDVGLGEAEAGLLYFFEPDNAEVLIKVLDGCEMNGHRWVFVAPVTTLAFNLRVVETATGRSWPHRNPRGGGAAKTASDLTAFPCDPAVSAAGGVAPPSEGAGAPAVATPVIAAAGGTDCAPEPVTTLRGGFTVSMCVEHRRDDESVVEQVKDYGLDSSRSALLYFFQRSNPEVLVKVLDGCKLNGRHWVFVAPVTTLAFNLSIDRPAVGDSWTHRNGQNRTAEARNDLTAFPCVAAPYDDSVPDDSIRGRIVGHRGDLRDVEVLLTAQGVLRVERPDASGWFSFERLARGTYFLKARADGHRGTPARSIALPREGRVELLNLTPIPSNPFVYHWEEDQSTSGTDYAANVNEPRVVEFEGQAATVADSSSATTLAHEYNILLVDTDDAAWSHEHAWRLLKTMRSIPQWSRRDSVQELPRSRWRLTPAFLRNDIRITEGGGSPDVLVSEAAFVNANPRVATVDGKRGVWFSKRLHHALVRYVTDGGRDINAYEKIFQERYGVKTEFHFENYPELTWPTGNEDWRRFQRFHPEEILTLLTMLEEFPSGMHSTPGLQYLIRRLDGLEHPLYPTAPAVAWPDAGYIEFMETAFTSFDVDHVQRLVVHEKAHFLWAHLFDDATRDDWIALGGWYEDPGSDSGWSTTKQTEFVSAYAHAKNPDEDMAETIAHFVVEPDKLRSRSTAKYDFVRDRIMQGDFYVSRIREDLTFRVYNLFPDYVFPGKVRRVDIVVEGGPDEEKEIRVEIELHALDGVLEGAAEALMRVYSSADSFFDMYLLPVDGSGARIEGASTVLVGTATLSRYAKAGYWVPDQLILTDPAGNQRFERGDDFGWQLYVENPLEDWTAPRYVAGTARLSKGQTIVGSRSVQTIEATWEVEEATGMREHSPCLAVLNDELAGTYSLELYGPVQAREQRCAVVFPMPDYMPSSRYFLNRIAMIDLAENWTSVQFTEAPEDEDPQSVRLTTATPDTEAPELDLNRISVAAEPTHPEAPNGETIVTVTFHVRDNISGYRQAWLEFRDPQGLSHGVWILGDERDRVFPSGDPTRWKLYTHTHVLPAGSAPGVWGVSEMTVYDRARNFAREDFTETIRFDVE